ncbi:cytochrome b/b6 domain-containing protein [Altericroceibacterium endophyticum]|uniref:DUF4405 domain-containing protein n=1 Tax=Altericroceibacterium endophyticum TaxID=1808508 RepID=A0A6I4T157_9SPHN|nr:cytochrome b/b6 domain-containing protein [Altericroceibacterium endophyticum]MXO64914.1 DUF4405 domain-containing protein [Altericroceibacterium endophyticum]
MSRSAPPRPLHSPRHRLTTRLWHWINFASVTVLFMSGLNISNAHPRLYWGKAGFAPEDAWAFIPRFPGWATIPNYYSLAIARDWHILFAWIFAVSLTVFMIVSLINRHFYRDLTTRWREWRPGAIGADIRAHLKLNFAHGARKYNFLQRAAYGLVIFVMLPLMILTGMAMSPGMEASWPWLSEIFLGRQSARSIHFLCAWGLFAFLILHVAMVLLSGPIGQLKAMIFGKEPE